MSDSSSSSKLAAPAEVKESEKAKATSDSANQLDGAALTKNVHSEDNEATDEDVEDAEGNTANEQVKQTPKATEAGNDDAKAGKGVKVTKTSPKKRIATASNDEEVSPKKKRAPAKGKAGKAEAKIKEESRTPDPINADVTPEGSGAEEDQFPVTPMKGKRSGATPKTPRTPKTPKNSNVAKVNDNTPSSKSTPRKRSVADKVADKVSLPHAWANASEADKELVAMKKDGKSWNDIRAMWLEKTGQDTATSTLPNRYKRLQIVMMQMSEEEKSLLATVKTEVESDWKNKKWTLIAAEMDKRGPNKFPVDFLIKEWKKIEVARAAAATAAGGDALLAAAQEASLGGDDDDEDEGDAVAGAEAEE